MTVLRIDTDRYAEAAALTAAAGQQLADAAGTAGTALGGARGMAGGDTPGAGWSASYDPAARDVLSACRDLALASADTSRALDLSAGAYLSAEHIAAGGLSALVGPHAPRSVDVPAAALLPSAGEGNPGWPPPCWDIVAGIAGVVWPSGDPALLRSAARTWDVLADEVGRGVDGPAASARHTLDGLLAEDLHLYRERSLEIEAAGRLVADASRDIARGCGSLASAIEEAHQELLDETRSFALECGTLVAVGTALSLVTLGGSAAVTTLVGAARTARMVLRVHEVLARLAALARTVSIVVARFPGAGRLTAGLRVLAPPRLLASSQVTAVRSAVASWSRAALTSRTASRLAPAVRMIRPLGAAGLRGLDSKAVPVARPGPAELVAGRLSYQVRRTVLGSRAVRGSETDQAFALLRASPLGSVPAVAVAERVIRGKDRVDAAEGLLALPGTIRNRTAPYRPARLSPDATGPGRLTAGRGSPAPHPRAGASRDPRTSTPAASP
ncbi:hypothetical protein AC792_14440 [Arthrobacter sp. RIT-PI-e]|uniref:hypothetical protein n=1 Tax=Arthrobacter sp. RIT-PI-e TaxID=1681197 RepID=UPI0006766655|nr:hypothetical protein [Arthrobacter sp. RIT-PI-e]KNC17276.1 hypothetical protein AC792_14440 [Arthrobacter sp. RIT-PI-e]